ncbi:hypothetical protein CF326_g6911 [Tilletia indica]|nr:hypothetical protein CF326_g6911 [Tilletia indica]
MLGPKIYQLDEAAMSLLLNKAQAQQQSSVPSTSKAPARAAASFRNPSLDFNQADPSSFIGLWDGAHLPIPYDIRDLFIDNVNIPISMLTVAAVQDFQINGRRNPSIHLPLSTKSRQTLEEWHVRDLVLPPAEWMQASRTFVHLWRFLERESGVMDDNSMAARFEQHLVEVQNRVTSTTWPIWLKYDALVRAAIFSGNPDSHLNFDVTQIHLPTLNIAELSLDLKTGAAVDFSDLPKSGFVLATILVVARERLSRRQTSPFDRATSLGQASSPRESQRPSLSHSAVSAAELSTIPGLTVPAPEMVVFNMSPSLEEAGSGKASRSPSAVASTQVLNPSTNPAPTATTAPSAERMATEPWTMASLPQPHRQLLLPPPPPDQLPQLIELDALSSEFNKRTSPLIWERFQEAIDRAPEHFRKAYAHVPEGVKSGFKMGSLASPYDTHISKNYFKAEDLETMKRWASDAVNAGFLAGPFKKEDVELVIGHFHTIPLKLLITEATPTKPRKERVVADASHPREVPGRPLPPYKSINDQQDAADAPCEWFLVVDAIMTFRALPSHARVMGYDFADAFQQVPNHPSQRPTMCVEVDGYIYTYLVGQFGQRIICGLFGQLVDVTSEDVETLVPEILVRHYVDDNIAIDLADPQSPLADRPESVVLDVVKSFGWRIHPKKVWSWARSFTYLGIDWDLDQGTFAIPSEKRDKYSSKLFKALNAGKVNATETSSIIGSLQHVGIVVPERRSHLNESYKFWKTFPRYAFTMVHFIPTAVRREWEDWLKFLSQDIRRSFLAPPSSFEHEVFSDACDFGLAVVIEGQAVQWFLPQEIIDDPTVDIGVKEMWALLLALDAVIARGVRNARVRFRVDNMGVVYAVRKGRSRSQRTNDAIVTFARRAFDAGIEPSITYIASEDNPSDAPSRGDMATFTPFTFDHMAPWAAFSMPDTHGALFEY